MVILDLKKKLLWQNKKLESLRHPQILNTVFEFY